MDFEELQENLEPAIEVFNKHKQKIAIVALIAVAAYVYLYVVPHPGTLKVSVYEMDGLLLNDAEVTITEEATGRTLATDLTSNGEVIFQKMPSQKKLTVEVAKGIAYLPKASTVSIESGGLQETTIQLERKNLLSFGASNIPSAVPVGCADDFNLEVKNSGGENFLADLAVEGDASQIISIPDNRKTIYSNSSTNFSVRVVASGEQPSPEEGAKTGTIRIKKTLTKFAIKMTLSPKTQLEITPNSLLIQSGKPRQKTTLRIYNAGQQAVTGISMKVNGDSDLREACGQNIESCISIEQLTGSETKELLPQTATLISLIITPPTEVGKTFLGSLEITADCLHKSPIIVPITIEVNQ